MSLPGEVEILAARQGFADAQAALSGIVTDRMPGLSSLGWYGTSVSQERGSFGLVNRGGPLESLVGDRIKLTANDSSVVVYVLASATLDYDIHITRRAFAAVSLLAVERLDAIVEVLAQ